MEEEIGRIKKNENTEIVIKVDDFGGKVGVSIREFVTSPTYTGFTKQGTRIPADKFIDFQKLIEKIRLDDINK